MADQEALRLDPQIEEVLKQLAAEPGSTLLRVQRPAVVRGFFEHREGVSVAQAGLNSAELEVLRSYRADVARLLLDACRMKLIAGPNGRVNFSPFRVGQEKHRVLTAEELEDRVRERGSIDDDRVSDCVYENLRQCIRDPAGRDPGVLDLIEVSMRLEPTDEARILAALELSQQGSPESAIRILKQMLSAPVSESLAVSTLNNLGMAHSFAEQMVEAHRCYSAACDADDSRIEPWLNRIVQSIQLGMEEDARLACHRIDELGSEVAGVVDVFVEAKRAQRKSGNWSPTHLSRAPLHWLESNGGSVTRRVVSVFG